MNVKAQFFQVLSGDEVESVHEASLRILSEVGLKFIDETALRILDEAGAEVDFKTEIVKMPSSLVEEMVRKAPRRFTLCALNPEKDLNIDGYHTYFGTGNALNILEGKGSRRILKEDLKRYMRLADALEHVDFCVGTGVADAPPKTWDIHQFEVMVNNSSKHLRPVIASHYGADAILKIAEAVVGGGEALAKRPIISVGYVASAPLRWDRTALYVFRRTAEYNLTGDFGWNHRPRQRRSVRRGCVQPASKKKSAMLLLHRVHPHLRLENSPTPFRFTGGDAHSLGGRPAG